MKERVGNHAKHTRVELQGNFGISYAKSSNISPFTHNKYSLKNKAKCITQFHQYHKNT